MLLPLLLWIACMWCLAGFPLLKLTGRDLADWLRLPKGWPRHLLAVLIVASGILGWLLGIALALLQWAWDCWKDFIRLHVD